ncbi:MAG TPA: type II secretion system secretin GspD [Azoarcus taiwanensis]|nr:type II secretion system secretin GspD [Azoarcus taiwanensis]
MIPSPSRLLLASLSSLILLLVGCATPQARGPQTVSELVALNLASDIEAVETPALREPGADRAAPRLFPGDDRVFRQPDVRDGISLDGDAVTLRFEEAPLADVVHAILGDLLEIDYTMLQAVEGRVSIHTHRPVPRDQVLSILESLLLANGYAMQRDQPGVVAVGRRDALRANVPLASVPGVLRPGQSSIVVPLQHIGATEMADIIGAVSSQENILRVDTVRNLLLLAGSRNQIEGWLDIVATFDVDLLQGMSVGLFPLEYLSVREAELAIRTVFGLGETGPGSLRALAALAGDASGGSEGVAAVPSSGGGSPLAGLVRVLPIERLNSLLVVTPRRQYLERIRVWIERFDQAGDSDAEARLFVYPVQNGSAVHLAALLTSIFGGQASGGEASPRAGDSGVAPGLSGSAAGASAGSGASAHSTGAGPVTTTSASLGSGVRVVADERNNALIIHAPGRQYRRIEAALRQLDIAPTQVLIEASILEVTLNDELRYGLQWYFNNSLSSGRQGVGRLTSTESGAIGAQNPGFSYTISSPGGEVRAVLNALAQKSLINVISTPTLMVLDNHSATIQVGDQQPIRTSETTNLDGNNVTSTVQYKDTGVTLEVSPSVNAGGMVTMDVKQSVTDVGQVDLATGQRSFLQRQLASRVAVRSGETIILGGLIRDNNSRGRQGVPLLHDIPVIGNLFGATTVNTDRTELLVMITPRVVRSEQDVREVGRALRDRMRRLSDLTERVGLPGEPDTAPAPSGVGVAQ